MPLLARTIAVLGAFCLQTGCLFDTIHNETLVGPYRLVAIDTMESMSIVWEIPGGGRVSDGLPGPTVFAAGFDDRYLVAAVHPPKCKPVGDDCSDFGMNRDVIDYWVVIRQPDERERLPYSGIKGPFSRERFERLRARFSLPAFSVRFKELD